MSESGQEEQHKARCFNCAWRGEFDEDGLMECHLFPPELIKTGRRVIKQRPRVSPFDYCSYCQIEVDRDGNVL